MALPPWLTKLDVLGPMQAGAHLGLGIRQANLAEAEASQRAQSAADQLQLHYAQLAGEVVNQQALREQARQSAAEALRVHEANQLHQQALEAHQLAQEQQAANALVDTNAFRQAQIDRWGRLDKPVTGPPASVTEIPIVDTQGKTNKDFFGVPSAGGKGVTVHKRTSADLSPEEQTQVKYQTAIATANAKIAAELQGTNPKGYSNALAQAQQATNVIHQIYNKPSAAPTAPVSTAPKPITKQQAIEFLHQTKGDKEKARALAREAGYEL